MEAPLIKLTNRQIAIIICALDCYQSEGEVVQHSLDVSADPKSVELLTANVTAIEDTRYLKEIFCKLMNE